MNVSSQQAKNTYRFILYGRARSGKTCYLAALAMDRHSNPLNHTSDWLSSATHCPRPSGDEKKWNLAEPDVARFKGKEWLEGAIAAIESGSVPGANPNELAPFRYLFEFRGEGEYPQSGKLKRVFTVELIDYSGELIDPNISEQQLAVIVRKHMLEADGIIVLAEAPRPDDDWNAQFPELRKLRLAFQLVRKMGSPVALVVNKWDRLQDKYTLESFMQREQHEAGTSTASNSTVNQPREPAHVSLRNALQTAVGDANFAMFPVSALGPCRSQEVFDEKTKHGIKVDIPVQATPLRSTGLEDPFLWLARRHDELLAGEISTRTQQLQHWKLWQVVLGIQSRLLRLLSRARGFIGDVPAWKHAIEASTIRSRATQVVQSTGIAAIIIVLTILFGMYRIAASDADRLAALRVRVRTPENRPYEVEKLQARLQELSDSDQWLTDYNGGGFWRFGSRLLQAAGREDTSGLHTELLDEIEMSRRRLSLSQDLYRLDRKAASVMTAEKITPVEAENIIQVENEFGKLVAQTKNVPDVQALLDAYWSNEIKLTIEKAKDQIARQSAKLRLTMLAGYIEEMRHADTSQQIDAICDKTKRVKEDWTKAKVLGDEENLKFAELEKETESAKGRVMDAANAIELASDYANERVNGKISVMADRILQVRAGAKEKTAKLQKELKAQFCKEWSVKLETAVQALVSVRHYESAEQLLSDTCSSGAVKEIVTEAEAEKQAENRVKWIGIPWAQQSWKQLKESPEDVSLHRDFISVAKKYRTPRHLELIPIVEERIQILTKPKMTLLLGVDKVTFSPSPSNLSDYAGKTFHVSIVRFDNDAAGPTLWDTQEEAIAYGKAATPQKDGETSFEMTRNESLKFRVKVRSEECTNKQLTALEPSNVFTYSLTDLADGVQLALVPLDRDKPQISVTVTLRGWEALPRLPEY